MITREKLIKFFATGFYSGFSPLAPGTAGSLVALLMIFLYLLAGNQVSFPLIFILFFFGTYLSQQAEKIFAKKDAQEIVIDEIVGMFIAVYAFDKEVLLFIIPAFILFRIFDILKPAIIGRTQKIQGGLGIMLDDVLAGIFANLIMQIILFIF